VVSRKPQPEEAPMKTWVLVLTLAVPIASLSAGEGNAGVPDPANSEADPCLVVCPAGDVVFRVAVHDFNNVPIEHSSVVIDFCDCPITLCPESLTDPYSRSKCYIYRLTDSQGRADFPIRAGGVCNNPGARVFADGVFLGARNVVSPDQDGNLKVEPADLAIVNGKVGSSDPTADFDCDANVSNADAQFVVVHTQHLCPPPDPTPATPRTWGQLKTIYR